MNRIGIPKAFFYHKHHVLWESFFDALNIDYIVSPDTNKQIIEAGTSLAIDEACLSSKIYLGHIDWLVDRCDRILVPRISSYGTAGSVCTKFEAIYDLVKNTFRDRDIKLLNYNLDPKNSEKEMKAFLRMGKMLGKKKPAVMLAYLLARQAEKTARQMEQYEQSSLLQKPGIKILVVSHRYNVCDKWIGEPVLKILEEMDTLPIIADYANSREALVRSAEISQTLPWAFNKELSGAVAMLREQVDGIILMSTFPCGPDSLANEILIRRVKDKPILNLVLDGQEGRAGLETRLESFIDIIRYRQDELIQQAVEGDIK